MTKDTSTQPAVMSSVEMVKVPAAGRAPGLVFVGGPRRGEAGDGLGRIDGSYLRLRLIAGQGGVGGREGVGIAAVKATGGGQGLGLDESGCVEGSLRWYGESAVGGIRFGMVWVWIG